VSNLYHSLIARIRSEVSDLEQIVERASRGWSEVQQASAAQFAYVDSVALNLHSFYSGLERLFELIARHVDRNLPHDETWHRDLLQQMAQDRPDTRPAVISQESATAIDEFRRFRHLVRNVYTIQLAPEKMAGLMEALPEIWPQLRAELLAFANFLDVLNASLD
jgi:hypothetical protein